MEKRTITAEEKAEELLMALGKELGERRAAFGEALMDDEQPDPPMFMSKEAWFEGRPQPKEHRSCRMTRKKRRALILAAVLILVMGMAVVSSDGVKLNKSTVHMEENPEESTMIIDSTMAVYDLEDFQVGYVPEGYELVGDTIQEDFLRRISYVDENDNRVQIFIVKTDHYGANIDNESAAREEVLVNDKQAYLFQDDITSAVIWQMGDCTIDIMARLSKDELIEVAKNIHVK